MSKLPDATPFTSATPLVVACLCAGWCTTCEAYRATFDAAAGRFPQARFAWIDIEDQADALGDAALDIENFPTLMLLDGTTPMFFGTVLPHAGTLTRMVEAALAGELAGAGLDANARALAPAVQALSQNARA